MGADVWGADGWVLTNNRTPWYSSMFAGLAQHFLILSRKKKPGLDFDELIEQWREGNDLFETLVHVATKLKKSPILIPLLKFSRLYVQAFINSGVNLLPELWQHNFKEGQAFTKTLQKSTRKIQSICEHSKILKDTILRNVPMMKKILETLIFKVREALGSKGITAGFFIGSLKLKDLDGKEIGSQPFETSDVEDEKEETQEDEDDAVPMNLDGGEETEGVDLEEDDEDEMQLGTDEDD